MAGCRVIRLTNVSVPTVAILKPKPEIDTGAAVVIAPGGGRTILAYDLEGTEIAERWLAAAQGGQRAMSFVRGRADEIGIDRDRIGIIGFSAGGTPVRYAVL